MEFCGGISSSLKPDGPQSVLARTVTKYATAIQEGLCDLVEQQSFAGEVAGSVAGCGMGASSEDLRQVHCFLRKEYKSVAAYLEGEMRIDMEMELGGDGGGKLTWSEAQGVMQREVSSLCQLLIDLGPPLRKREDELLNAVLIIQRAVRMWQYVFVGHDRDKLLGDGGPRWSFPSYTMVPDMAAVVFWHNSGQGCLCAQSSWEVIEECGLVGGQGSMPLLFKPRLPVGLDGMRLAPGICEGSIFLLRRNGDGTISLQASNGEILPRMAKLEGASQGACGSSSQSSARDGVERESTKEQRRPDKLQHYLNMGWGHDWSLHGRFFIEYEEESGSYSIREAGVRVGLDNSVVSTVKDASDEDDSMKGIGNIERPKVTMLDGDGDWRWKIEIVSFPDINIPRERRSGGFFGIKLLDDTVVALRSEQGTCVSVDESSSMLSFGSGDLIGPRQIFHLRRCAILPQSANVFVLQTELELVPASGTADPNRGRLSMFKTSSRKGSWKEEKKLCCVGLSPDRFLTATVPDVAFAEPFVLEPIFSGSSRANGYRLKSITLGGAYVTVDEETNSLRVMAEEAGGGVVCRLMGETFSLVPIHRQELVKPAAPTGSTSVGQVGTVLGDGFKKAAATLSPAAVFSTHEKTSQSPARSPTSNRSSASALGMWGRRTSKGVATVPASDESLWEDATSVARSEVFRDCLDSSALEAEEDEVHGVEEGEGGEGEPERDQEPDWEAKKELDVLLSPTKQAAQEAAAATADVSLEEAADALDSSLVSGEELLNAT
mmetsp:Transcript_71309/g.148849  ORF Transcript_71309/g.148849 Transcript_71309/m.148849 type:complete len:775 (-) Transcript_71309:32-2356(-)